MHGLKRVQADIADKYGLVGLAPIPSSFRRSELRSSIAFNQAELCTSFQAERRILTTQETHQQSYSFAFQEAVEQIGMPRIARQIPPFLSEISPVYS